MEAVGLAPEEAALGVEPGGCLSGTWRCAPRKGEVAVRVKGLPGDTWPCQWPRWLVPYLLLTLGQTQITAIKHALTSLYYILTTRASAQQRLLWREVS